MFDILGHCKYAGFEKEWLGMAEVQNSDCGRARYRFDTEFIAKNNIGSVLNGR